MKKAVSVILVLSLVFTLLSSMSAFAADLSGDFDAKLKLSSIDWSLSEDGTYWEATLNYCAENNIPEAVASRYQYMKVYVPAQYLYQAVDGSFVVDNETFVNGYTAATAPIIFKNNCTGWNSSVPGEADNEWIAEGWIHVECGARSRDAAAENGEYADLYSKSPAQIVDLKSGLRLLRLNQELIPGDFEKIISYGISGGGQMSSMLGATGNMEAYYEMLWENGAAGIVKNADGSYDSTISDAVYGCMCFVPIATLDAASIAQAWMRYDSTMNGNYQFTEFERQLEADMAVAFCEYINGLGLKNDDGEILSFDIDGTTGKPNPRSGSYYEQTLKNMSDALNSFASAGSAIFPYTVRIGMGPTATYTTYDTFEDLYASYKEMGDGYVNNGTDDWIVRNDDDTYSVTDFAGFFHGTGLTRFKGIPAFDAFGYDEVGDHMDAKGKYTENDAFGEPGTVTTHYSAAVAKLLQDNYEAYSKLDGFEAYQTYVDEFIDEALDNAYLKNQLYLMDSMQIMLDVADGAQKADIAPQWRMRMGTADQNSFAIAYNFCMAAQMAGSDMDYYLVWAMPHGADEGTSTGTFVDWANEISAEDRTEAPDSVKAVASPQQFIVDGKAVDGITAYNIDGYNYVKLRDVAMLLSDTSTKFDVSYDESTARVSVTTGNTYSVSGGELAGKMKSDSFGNASECQLFVNGTAAQVQAYVINGENYFKLRDLGTAIGFQVDYDFGTNTAIVIS